MRCLLAKQSRCFSFLICIKVDFHLSVCKQERERNRKTCHVNMRSSYICILFGKIFVSFLSREKVELTSSFSPVFRRERIKTNQSVFSNFAHTAYCSPKIQLSSLFTFFFSFNFFSRGCLFKWKLFFPVLSTFPVPFPFLSINGQVEIHR